MWRNGMGGWEGMPTSRHIGLHRIGIDAGRQAMLDGSRATSNKRSCNWVRTQGPHVEWVTRESG